MATKLERMVVPFKALLPKKSHGSKITILARIREKLKPLRLHYHSAYGHQIWQAHD